jgi:uncharacterized OsmC-like protein
MTAEHLVTHDPLSQRTPVPKMNAEELRRLQAPFKTRYKENAESAKHTFRATATLLHDRPACRVESAFGTIDAGLHPAAGGDGSDACAGDMMLQAVVACAGVTFNSVATAMSLPFRSAKVIVEGDGDFRGTLGVARDAPVGVTDIRIRFEIDSRASDEQLATLMNLTERYCVVLQTLLNPPRVQAKLERVTT